MMRFVVIVIAALFSVSAHATHIQHCEGVPHTMADGHNIICSATWQFSGKCTGEDMWNRWTVTGRTSPGDSFVRPWLDVPIFVVGYELVKLQSPSLRWFLLHPLSALHQNPLSWFMLGSTITPDMMLAIAPGERHAKQFWPSGYGQPWPAAKEARPVAPLKDSTGKTYAASGDLLDLHGVCFDGAEIGILLTVYYTPLQ